MATPHSARPRLMLLFTTTGYEAREFVQAAQQLGVDTVLGSDRCHVLDDPWQDGALPLRFERPQEAAQHILDYARSQPLDAILPIGDTPVLTAALANQALDFQHHVLQVLLLPVATNSSCASSCAMLVCACRGSRVSPCRQTPVSSSMRCRTHACSNRWRCQPAVA